MNSLFLGLLTMFCAQGLFGRDTNSARWMAGVFVAGLLTALIYSLR
jgi:hypothetical protein